METEYMSNGECVAETGEFVLRDDLPDFYDIPVHNATECKVFSRVQQAAINFRKKLADVYIELITNPDTRDSDWSWLDRFMRRIEI